MIATLRRQAVPLPSGVWAPLLLAAAVLAAFWRSYAALLPLLGADTALGMVPAVPLLAVWLAVATLRDRRRRGLPIAGTREMALDGPVGMLLLVVAAWLLVEGPNRGWYFWSQRLDLLAAVLTALGLAAWLWGVQTLWWYRGAALFSLLVWPEPLLRLQEVVAPPLATATAVLARPLAGLLGAHFAPVRFDPAIFTSLSARPWTIIIGDTCAGLNAGLAVLLVGLPARVHLGLPWRRALPWLAAGVLLALASNLARVVALLVVANRSGTAFALGQVHPVLGAVLLAAVFAALWGTGLVLRPRGGPAVLEHAPARSRTSLGQLGVVGLVLAATSLASIRLDAFRTLPPIGPPGGVLAQARDYLRLPPGWYVEDEAQIGWQNLFGPESESYALNLRSSSGALVKAQLVTTPDGAALDRFGLEACRVYHGEDVVGRRQVALPGGGQATLVNSEDTRPGGVGRLSVLYWQAPFEQGGRLLNARLALFVVQPDESTLPSTFTPGLAPGGAAFDRAAATLVELGRGIAAGIVAASPAPHAADLRPSGPSL